MGYEQQLDRVAADQRQRRAGLRRHLPGRGSLRGRLRRDGRRRAGVVWVLPVALAGQCLLLAVYSELAVAVADHRWRLPVDPPADGEGYGWMTGWVAIWAYLVANTTIAYLGAPWALTLLGIEPTANAIVLMGMVLVVVCAAAGAVGVRCSPGRPGRDRRRSRGIRRDRPCAAAGVPVNDPSLLTHTLGAEALSGGSVGAALLAALAVGGWVFIGFDCCVAASEETHNAARHVPRAIWIALLSVAALVLLDAVAAALAHPDPASVVAGQDPDPVTTAVASGFGSWSEKPFAAIVLVAFLACGMSAQSLTARTVFSLARDGVLPGSRPLRVVDARHVPIGAVVLTTVVACLGSAARVELGRRRQPDHVRHGRDLPDVLPDRAGRAAGSDAGSLGTRWARPARAPRAGLQRARGRLAGVRDREHRVAAPLARPARRAGLSGLGCAAVPGRASACSALPTCSRRARTAGSADHLGNADRADLGGLAAPRDERGQQAERRAASAASTTHQSGVAAGEAGRVRRAGGATGS